MKLAEFGNQGDSFVKAIIFELIFSYRQELFKDKQHKSLRSGISYDANGATAVILSGGYEDDYSENNGEVV